jgi:hypothetical protein
VVGQRTADDATNINVVCPICPHSEHGASLELAVCSGQEIIENVLAWRKVEEGYEYKGNARRNVRNKVGAEYVYRGERADERRLCVCG